MTTVPVVRFVPVAVLIGPRQWEKAADEWNLDRDLVGERLINMASTIPAAATELSEALSLAEGVDGGILPVLVKEISDRAESCLLEFRGS